MSEIEQELQALQDIRKMMEKSSRFISLSGWSGVSAGLAALAGAYIAHQRITTYFANWSIDDSCPDCLMRDLIIIASSVFLVALATAFLFTWTRAKKEGVAIWGTTSKRLLWNTILPMVVGGVVILRMISLQYYDLVAAVSLIFYGLALINGSKYTLGEVKYLGYAIVIIGLVGLWVPRQGLLLWALGFGVLHILYGFVMWWKYERRISA
ncbi:MAG: hypothetical protein WBP58_18160 [Chitinophagaceae bacterium]